MIKIDSTLAVVYDIVIGGSKYNYYINVVVQHRNRSFETLSPELLNKIQK